jgi:type II secretory ATPase GspE/PulE/Tfp pilus assembly ATPase PilB-like protein
MADQLGELLVKKGYLSRESLEQLVLQAKKQNMRLGQYLIREGIVKREQLGEVLSEQEGKPYMDSSTILQILDSKELNSSAKLSTYFGKPADQLMGIMRTYRLIPLGKDEKGIQAVVVPPIDKNTLRRLHDYFRADLDYAVTTEEDFSDVVVARFFNLDTLAKATDEHVVIKEVKVTSLDLLATEASAENALNILFFDGAHRGATDIHFISSPTNYIIKYRIDGIVQEMVQIPKSLAEEAITRVKVLADMDIAEKRRPQDGQFDLVVENQSYSIRVATVGSIYGENMFLRLLYRRSLRTGLDSLGMLPEQVQVIREMIRKPYGILVTTGPTGSGKTTTLYALLKEIYEDRDKNIITIEDPVEYDFEGITQIQINPKADITFSGTLRAALRQDPDIILVGEIRDEETMRTALDAALSGHLVLSTLHANNAVAAIARFMSMGADPMLVASALNCVMAQRLVRVWDVLSQSYRGRMGVFEILPLDDDMRKMISAKADIVDLYALARAKGFVSMEEIAEMRVNQGVTTPEEVVRVIGSAV